MYTVNKVEAFTILKEGPRCQFVRERLTVAMYIFVIFFLSIIFNFLVIFCSMQRFLKNIVSFSLYLSSVLNFFLKFCKIDFNYLNFFHVFCDKGYFRWTFFFSNNRNSQNSFRLLIFFWSVLWKTSAFIIVTINCLINDWPNCLQIYGRPRYLQSQRSVEWGNGEVQKMNSAVLVE